MEGNEFPYTPCYPYTFDLGMFDSDKLERVTVYAENRVRAFSLAALQAESPCNVMEVTLISDNGVEVDRYHQGAGITSPSPSYSPEQITAPKRGRLYFVELNFILPRGSEPGEASWSRCLAVISGRPLAFSDAIIESGSADYVWQSTMLSVSDWVRNSSAYEDEPGDYIDFEEGKKYGGVTIDLHDWL